MSLMISRSTPDSRTMFTRFVGPIVIIASLRGRALADKSTRDIYKQNKWAVVLLPAPRLRHLFAIGRAGFGGGSGLSH